MEANVEFRQEKGYDLGVLLVHGIGRQPSGETLVRWGDVLLKTIGRATGNKVAATATLAGPDATGGRGEGRAEATVQLRAGGARERWLLSEGWWADAFLAPSYRELVSWSVRALPWSVALHVAQGHWQTAAGQGTLRKVTAGATSTVKLLIALLISPVFILLLALSLLLGLLPIPQLRALILAAQGTLAETIGDSMAFVESPIRAALIRTRVLDGIERLKQRCKRTIIIAHSQGAAVVLDALGGMVGPGSAHKPATENDAKRAGMVPDTLLTFGAGTNQLASLKVLSAGLPASIGTNPVSYAISALAFAAGMLAWLYADVRRGSTTLRGILAAGGLLFLFFAVLGLAAWAVIKWMVPALGRRWRRVREHQEAVMTGILVVLMLGALVPMNVYADHRHIPILPVDLLVLAVLGLVGCISMILSKNMETILTVVRKPPELGRWVDIYASADPVPNGPTMTQQEGVLESIGIWNLGSIFSDHTAYWQNLDEFVLRVVKVCAETAESPWREELPTVTRGVDERAKWRVGWLRLARFTVGAVWIALGAILWNKHGGVALPARLPDWLPEWLRVLSAKTSPLAVLAVLIAAAILASFGILRLIWQVWAHVERKAVITHQQPKGSGFLPLLLMGMFVWCILGLLLPAVIPERFGLENLLAGWGELVNAFWIVFGLSLISALFLRKLFPAPHPPDASPDDGAQSATLPPGKTGS